MTLTFPSKKKKRFNDNSLYNYYISQLYNYFILVNLNASHYSTVKLNIIQITDISSQVKSNDQSAPQKKRHKQQEGKTANSKNM